MPNLQSPTCTNSYLATKATPSCTSVSGPGFFQRSCGRVVNQHHSNQYWPIRLFLNANFGH